MKLCLRAAITAGIILSCVLRSASGFAEEPHQAAPETRAVAIPRRRSAQVGQRKQMLLLPQQRRRGPRADGRDPGWRAGRSRAAGRDARVSERARRLGRRMAPRARSKTRNSHGFNLPRHWPRRTNRGLSTNREALAKAAELVAEMQMPDGIGKPICPATSARRSPTARRWPPRWPCACWPAAMRRSIARRWPRRAMVCEHRGRERVGRGRHDAGLGRRQRSRGRAAARSMLATDSSRPVARRRLGPVCQLALRSVRYGPGCAGAGGRPRPCRIRRRDRPRPQVSARAQEADGGWPATTRPSGVDSYAERISTSGWATASVAGHARRRQIRRGKEVTGVTSAGPRS